MTLPIKNLHAIARKWRNGEIKSTYFVTHLGWGTESRLIVSKPSHVFTTDNAFTPISGAFVIDCQGPWKPAAYSVCRLQKDHNLYIVSGPRRDSVGRTVKRTGYRDYIGQPGTIDCFKVSNSALSNQLHLGFWMSAFVSPVQEYFVNNFMINYILMIPEDVHKELREELNGDSLRDPMVIENLLIERAAKLQLWVDDRYRQATDAGLMTTERNRLKKHVLPVMMELGIKVKYRRQVDIQKDLTAFRMPEYLSLEDMQNSKKRLLSEALVS